MRNVISFQTVVGILLFMLAFSCQTREQAENNSGGNDTEKIVTVAAAANIKLALEEVNKSFEEERNIRVKLVAASSGKLTAQITNGSPIDVFLSANMKYPEHLHAEGHVAGQPEIYAYGSLVLWTTKDLDVSKGMDLLLEEQVQKIAIANDKNAPYGSAAMEALKSAGIYDRVKDKLVYGESISQVNQYIAMGSVDVGLTSQSVVISKMNMEGIWFEIERDLYQPISQGAVLLKHGMENNQASSSAYFNFLFSEKARQIFKKYGYQVPEHG